MKHLRATDRLREAAKTWKREKATDMAGTHDATLEESMEAMVSGGVFRGEPMDRHTSFGVGGIADYFVVPANSEETVRLVDFLAAGGVSFLPLGKGTNLLVLDGGYRGVIISLKNLQGLQIRQEDDDETLLVRGEAGLPITRLIDCALKDSLEGLEFLAGIPGTLGGALRMNAGAWGSEIKDVVRSLTLVVPGRGAEVIPRSRLAFAYRKLELPEGSVIAAAELAVRRGDRDVIECRIREIMDKRKKRHPLEYRSAGSVFKNPPGGVPAGRLIEEAGLKGLVVGDAMISELHGNFIVNRGKAKAAHIIELIEEVRMRIRDMTGIELETEIVIVGEDI